MLDVTKIHEAIDAFVLTGPEEVYTVRIPARNDKPRNYLGLSGLGDSCVRKVWYQWRHAFVAKFPSRMLRLFRRGDVEEYRFNFLLRGIGFTVHETDDEGNQFSIKDFENHLSGHMDGAATAPKKFWKRGTKPVPFIVEYKSYNDKRFRELTKRGVKNSDPKYYVQMQGYMGYEDLTGALFCAVNKDNEELYFEWVPFASRAFALLVGRAGEIIEAQSPPKKLSETPSYFECKWCDAHAICHGGKPALKSCRSCKFAVPVEAGAWKCEKGNEYGTVCKSYKDITK